MSNAAAALRVRLIDVDLTDPAEFDRCDLSDFCEVNGYDAAELTAEIAECGYALVGGGAAPLVRVEVVS